MITLEKNKIKNNMNEKKILKKKGKKQLLTNIVFLLIIIVICFLVANFHGFGSNETSDDNVDFSGINKICELSTLRCYYHNVAELKKNPDGLFQYGWFKYGYKKLWIEYTGIIEIGIDVDQVHVNGPDENNFIYVFVPNARIINVSADSNSMSKPISDTGTFTEITTDDQNQAFSQAQKYMEKEANNDITILNSAKNNAKKLIEQYIINVGKQVGKEYKVKWLDKPKNTQGDILKWKR